MQHGAGQSLSNFMSRGAAAINAGKFVEAEQFFRQAAQAYGDAGAYSNLAMALAAQGRLGEAVEASQRACQLRPEVPELHANLGNALQLAGQIDPAIDAYRHALRLRPPSPDVRLNLGHALIMRGDFVQAVEELQHVLASQPGNPAGLINLGIALHRKGDLDAAAKAFESLIRLHDTPDAHANLALVLKDAGRVGDAIPHVRRSLQIRPDARTADLFLLLIHYHPAFDAAQIAEEHRRWFVKFIEPHARPRIHQRRGTEGRKIRIGYVSPDFRRHPVGYNVLPLIENHDRGRFEIFCYSNVTRPDGLTDHFRAASDVWREIRPLSDDQAADMILRDGIDVLVDLALHTGENRLGVFARKPAPVQVTFAGYPGTTGLPAIDYRLTDPYLDPPDVGNRGFCEKPLRLPHSFWCYQPLGDEPEVNPLPALTNGYVTFGCLNNFCKVNDPVLGEWAKVLSRVTGSRLILLAHLGSHRARTLRYLGNSGIDAGRIEFVAPRERPAYLHAYHRVDIGLDTFPYNGHTTSLDAYWMGVPVVSLVGDLPAGRAAWSQLNNLNLSHLAASGAQCYVQTAVDLASHPPTLSELRATLRERMRRSVLCDPHGFARAVEAIFLQVLRNEQAATTS